MEELQNREYSRFCLKYFDNIDMMYKIMDDQGFPELTDEVVENKKKPETIKDYAYYATYVLPDTRTAIMKQMKDRVMEKIPIHESNGEIYYRYDDIIRLCYKDGIYKNSIRFQQTMLQHVGFLSKDLINNSFKISRQCAEKQWASPFAKVKFTSKQSLKDVIEKYHHIGIKEDDICEFINCLCVMDTASELREVRQAYHERMKKSKKKNKKSTENIKE